MVRLAAYGAGSSLLAGYVVLSAFRQRSNFFSAAVYLSKSNACMMILWNFGVFLTILFGRALQSIFFGPLRLVEIERLHERAWYAVTESLLALTIFREEFDTSFVVLFTSLLFLKVFHWLAADRVEMMDSSPSIPKIFHFRMITVLSTLWIIDILLIIFAADSILLDGPSVMIMFASEYMIMLATLLGTTLKYGVNVHDLRRSDAGETWENKSVYTFYIDLACDFLKLATYLCFFSLILTFYGLPLNILRDVYITARSFAVKVRDLIRYRRATKNMDERYPNATAEELERLSDKTCIICREEMEARAAASNNAGQIPAPAGAAAATPAPARSGPNNTPKKLPCAHIFHFHCLRSWLERQQSCPTCRRPVLSDTQPATATAAAGAAGAQGQARQLMQNGAPPGGIVPGQQQQQYHAQPQQQVQQPAGQQAPAPPQPGQAPRPLGQAGAQSTAAAPTAGTAQRTNLSGGGPGNPTSEQERATRAMIQDLRARHPDTIPPRSFEAWFGDGHASRTTASSSGSSRRQRAGLDNPLVAFGNLQMPVVPVPVAAAASTSAHQQQQQQQQQPAIQGNQGEPSTSIAIPPNASAPTIALDTASASAATTLTPTPTQPAGGPASVDAHDRAAIRQRMEAAARARMGTLAASASPSLTKPTSTPTVPALASAGGASTSRSPSAIGLDTVPAAVAPPSPQTPLAAEQPANINTNTQAFTGPIEVPRLIPLFDTSNPSQPSPYARFFPSLMRANLFPDLPSTSLSSSPYSSSNAPSLSIPSDLSEDQLATLAEITKEGLETRLRLLSNTQETLNACVRQMQDAINVLSGGEVQSVLRVVSELNQAAAAAGAAGNAENGKGKGKGKASDVNNQ